MKTEQPRIDSRKFNDIVKILRESVPHYTPEWAASDEKDPGIALIKIFSHMTEAVINRFNQVPGKNFVAFLDMLGIRLLPARSARVPLTFKLANGTDKDIPIPERTQAATDKTEEHEELPFETEKKLLATISNLKEAISVDPFKDRIYLHTSNILSKDGNMLDEQKAFTVFSGTNQQEHSLYLGHKDLFNMESNGKITLEITMAPGTEAGNSGLNLVWEYWGKDKKKTNEGWILFQVVEDGTSAFRQSGKISLINALEGKIKEEKLGEIFKKTSKPEIKNEAFRDLKTRWIRCRLKDALNSGSCMKLPTIDTIFVTVTSGDGVKPDSGFSNDVPLDFTQAMECTPEDGAVHSTNGTPDGICVFPFGKQPRIYDTFYISSQEAFSKKNAKIILEFTLLDNSDNIVLHPILSWEYWDGKGWQVLTIRNDTTNRFLNSGSIEFYSPEDMEETAVGGQKNYWIRVRIVGGDYGGVNYTDPAISPNYRPPIIRKLTINYSFEDPKELQSCFSFNNLDIQDKTLSSRTTGKFFQPFIPLEDTHLSLYLGFEGPLNGGPICMFFAVKELALKCQLSFEILPMTRCEVMNICPTSGGSDVSRHFTPDDKGMIKMEWNYRNRIGWALLDQNDETKGLTLQGILEIIVPSDSVSLDMFGSALYWIQGSLIKEGYEYLPELQGIYPNTTWAIQAETIKDEILGSSDGEPDQNFSFFRSPVLEGQEIRLREILSEEEKQTIITLSGEDAIFQVRDEKGKLIETWVLWSEVPDFFNSREKSRHYTLDHATGQVQFGDGINGMIPPPGDDNIEAFSYQSGGGARGNIRAKEIKTLMSAVAGIDKVSNYAAAEGGADTAILDEMMKIGPAMISHRNRAVTFEDFEWLAKKASREVAKARCLPNINNNKHMEVGWVTVIIVPSSPDDKPCPSPGLVKIVREYLEAHCENSISHAKHVHVDGPFYVEIGVSADAYVTSIGVASEVELEIKRKLRSFFHPLTGGAEGKGWEFGRTVPASDIYALLEDVDGVDHLENLRFTHNGIPGEDIVEIKKDSLVASGIHNVNILLAKGG